MITRLLLITAIVAGLLSGCAPKTKPLAEPDVAMAWADMTLFITRNTPANTPTYSSRCLGYIGLTMYESVVAGDSAHQSMAGQLNGLDSLPKPEPAGRYQWVLALNAGQAQILRTIYNQTSDANKQKIDSLEVLILTQFASQADSATVARSVRYGRVVASRIFDWSKTDGGHRAYLKNFDKTLRFTNRPGCWNPPLYAQSFSHFPLHPHWGQTGRFSGKMPPLFRPGLWPSIRPGHRLIISSLSKFMTRKRD